MKTFISIIFFLTVIFTVAASNIERSPDPKWSKGRWNARWIEPRERSLTDYGVFFLRKNFRLNEQPDRFVINVSADNRYRLFVNGKPVCWGPARGDIRHWYYETVDISSFLQKGKNVISAVLWNFGRWSPGAQISLYTGFILQGDSKAEEIINSNDTWLIHESKAYTPTTEFTHDVGCGDRVDGKHYPWGWTETTFDDSGWKSPRMDVQGVPYGENTECKRFLLPRDIPLMVEEPLRLHEARRSEGVEVPAGFVKGKASLTVPSNKKATILFDQSFLTTAYPELTVSGGKDSKITLLYTEGLYGSDRRKGNRNDIEGRNPLSPLSDVFMPDGGKERLFRPLWFKTYRYITMEIETADEPLVINDLIGQYTGYPFKENGMFSCNDKSISKIWEVGWRTARLCAHETYYDCPYYEQLQYVGDTRIQALISLYVDGDDRLMRKAIKMFDWSRTYEGITMSRYPTTIEQYIPTFSLIWITMVHDYYMYRKDDEFIKSCLPGIKSVIDWYRNKLDHQTGILGATPHWNFVDWPMEWPWSNTSPTGGVAPGGHSGGSSVTSLLFVYALQHASELMRKYDDPYFADGYDKMAKTLQQNIYQKCWNNQKQLMKDDLNETSYSQHANILSILTNTVPTNEQKPLFDRINADTSLVQATVYFRFYMHRAMKKVGEQDRYLDFLDLWHDMLANGLTTFAERPEPSRSDCHAWSASPNFDLLSIVCGIEPDAPGFESVKIEPRFGKLKNIKGKVPHPKGTIELFLTLKEGKPIGTVLLPKEVKGRFVYNNKTITLKEGVNNISM